MGGFVDDDLVLIDIEDYCSANYSSSFVPSFLQMWAEFQESTGITTIDVLRCFLFLSVSLFLCTAVLLQGTLVELGIIHCQRQLGRWNALLTKSCRRLSR